MPLDPQEFAQLLGAEVVGTVPDVGGRPLGLARLGRLLHEQLTPSRGERTDLAPDQSGRALEGR
jgi:hypothetical protein